MYRQFLIEPEKLDIAVGGNCHGEQNFVIKMGRIVKGQVDPKIQGVEIIMTANNELLQSTLTDSEGRYELAPVEAGL